MSERIYPDEFRAAWTVSYYNGPLELVIEMDGRFYWCVAGNDTDDGTYEIYVVSSMPDKQIAEVMENHRKHRRLHGYESDHQIDQTFVRTGIGTNQDLGRVSVYRPDPQSLSSVGWIRESDLFSGIPIFKDT